MNTIIKRCEKIAEEYPFSAAEIFGLYNLITDCRKANGFINLIEDEQFIELKRILDFCGESAYNPLAVIDLIYSPVWKR